MKNLKYFTLTIIFYSVLFTSLSFAQQVDFQLYYKARKLLQQREYEKAQESFELLKTKYPNSRYIDDAGFWSAYILEKRGKDSAAFNEFKKFKGLYPHSAWVDDAESQQIDIAAKLARRGDNSHVNFIVNKLRSPDKKIKYRAAVSLGKLRDQRALPVLKQMEKNGDKDMGSVAKSLIRNVEKKPIKINPRYRVQPDKKKQPDDFQSKRRTVRQPGSRTSEKMPDYRKQSSGRKTPSPRVSRPPSGSRTKSRTPAVKTKPTTQRSGSKKSSSPKKK